MNCILIDKKLGVYFVAPKLHSSKQSAAAILPIERARKINDASNGRYNIQLSLINWSDLDRIWKKIASVDPIWW